MQAEDIKFYRSKTVTDTADNGGVMDISREIVSGVKFNLFPRVTSGERASGKVRYRKAYMANRAGEYEPAYDACLALTVPSIGGDRFYIKAASGYMETQSQLDETGWTGGGKLYAPIKAGDSQIQVLFEHNDYSVAENSLILVKSEDGRMFTARTTGNASWTGNVALLTLDSQSPDNFSADDTHAGVCVEFGNLEIKTENITAVSGAGIIRGASGIIIRNAGTIDDDWTLTFTSASSFNVSGVVSGSLPSGSISNNYYAVNAAVGDNYFVIASQFWGGTWKTGDKVTFSTKAAAKAFWLKEVIPAGTEREADNFIRLDWITD